VKNGKKIGMYDDNTTPAWALLWAHGITGGSRRGWTFAHVWPACDDINSFTHPANLALVSECFASLTDKDGPLTAYLRWHAWTVYGWKPSAEKPPQMPQGYKSIRWRYLTNILAPRQFIRQRLEKLTNQRVRILRPIMKRRGML
jgi:hypothetical protein